jgi:hypothetical protein
MFVILSAAKNLGVRCFTPFSMTVREILRCAQNDNALRMTMLKVA